MLYPLPVFSCTAWSGALPLTSPIHTFGTPHTSHITCHILLSRITCVTHNRREEIGRGDLEECDSLFHDAKFSARLLAEQADKYIS